MFTHCTVCATRASLLSMTTAHAYEPVPTLDSFGARLAIIRWAKGWNTKEAALACRVKESSWREWEAGRSPRKLVEIARSIAESTGYSDYWIMTGVDVTPTPEPGPGRRKSELTSATRRTCVEGVTRSHLRLVAA